MSYEKKKRFIVDIMFFAAITAVIIFIIKYLLVLIMPFLIAFASASLIAPFADRISADFKINRKITACFAVFVFYILVAGGILLFFILLYHILKKLIYDLPFICKYSILPAFTSFAASIHQFLQNTNPALCEILTSSASGFIKNFSGIISDISIIAIERLSSNIIRIPHFAVAAFISVIATFFIVSDYQNIRAFIIRQIPQKWHFFLKDVLNHTIKTLVKYSKSYLLITAITFCESAVALWLLGAENFAAVAFVIAVFDIIPVCGSGGILIPWAIFALMQDRFTFGAGMLTAYAVITIVRQIIEPKIVGDQVGIPPVVTLIAMFFGAHFIGVFGLFTFPLIIVILKKLNDSGHIKLFK